MKLLDKQIEVEVEQRKKSEIKKKIEIQKAYHLINTCVKKIDFENEDIVPLKEKVSDVISNFKENINKAENLWLDMIQYQERKFLHKLFEKKANKKVNYLKYFNYFNFQGIISSSRRKDRRRSTKISQSVQLKSELKTVKTPTKENTQEDPKILSSNVAKVEAAYLKRPKTSIFNFTDDYVKKVLYYIKMSFDMPMNSVITTFDNNFKKRIKMNEDYSEQRA